MINKREKILLLILGICLVLFGYYKFIFSPQSKKMDKLKGEILQSDIKINTLKSQALLSKKLKSDIKVINAKILNSSKGLLPELQEENIIIILDSIIKHTRINNDGFTISDVTLENVDNGYDANKDTQKSSLQDIVNQYNLLNDGQDIRNNSPSNGNENNTSEESNKETSKTNENNDNSNNTKKDKDITNVEKVTVSMSFEGKYNDLQAFIYDVENYPKKIIIDNLSINALDNENISVSLNLSFYLIPYLIDDGSKLTDWDYNGDYGKDNPFKASVNKVTQKEDKTEKVKYDFIMTTRPYSSDLPTVMLGKSEDKNQETYIYADNVSVQDVNIYLTEKDGKYYYRYDAGNSMYPTDNNSIGAEFTPYGNNINFKVYSNFRNSGIDMSGVNLKVYNKSNLKVVVNIQDDDITRPRVNVIKEKGQVNIERK